MRVVAVVQGAQKEGWRAAFCGGTSLSKGYGLVKRFSEDLDFRLFAPGIDPKRSRRRPNPERARINAQLLPHGGPGPSRANPDPAPSRERKGRAGRAGVGWVARRAAGDGGGGSGRGKRPPARDGGAALPPSCGGAQDPRLLRAPGWPWRGPRRRLGGDREGGQGSADLPARLMIRASARMVEAQRLAEAQDWTRIPASFLLPSES